MTRDDMVDVADLVREAQDVKGFQEDGEFVLAEYGEYERWMSASNPVDLELAR